MNSGRFSEIPWKSLDFSDDARERGNYLGLGVFGLQHRRGKPGACISSKQYSEAGRIYFAFNKLTNDKYLVAPQYSPAVHSCSAPIDTLSRVVNCVPSHDSSNASFLSWHCYKKHKLPFWQGREYHYKLNLRWFEGNITTFKEVFSNLNIPKIVERSFGICS
jgi:hypothetical protein